MSSNLSTDSAGGRILGNLQDLGLLNFQVFAGNTTRVVVGPDRERGVEMFEKIQQISVVKLLIICATIVASLGVLMVLVTGTTAILADRAKSKRKAVSDAALDEEKVDEMVTDPEAVSQSTGTQPEPPEIPEPAV